MNPSLLYARGHIFLDEIGQSPRSSKKSLISAMLNQEHELKNRFHLRYRKKTNECQSKNALPPLNNFQGIHKIIQGQSKQQKEAIMIPSERQGISNASH